MHIPEFIKTYGLTVAVIAASFIVAAQFIAPPPPRHITFAAGPESGLYYAYAQKYRDALAEEKIDVTVLTTEGAIENIQLLQSGRADVAFVQSGLADPQNRAAIEALSSLYYEPLWVFVRKESFSAALVTSGGKDSLTLQRDLRGLIGKRLVIGSVGQRHQRHRAAPAGRERHQRAKHAIPDHAHRRGHCRPERGRGRSGFFRQRL
jgi:hypothetical protein